MLKCIIHCVDINTRYAACIKGYLPFEVYGFVNYANESDIWLGQWRVLLAIHKLKLQRLDGC